jgi:hypothetical protein
MGSFKEFLKGFCYKCGREFLSLSYLFIDRRKKAAGLVIEALLAGIVTDVPDGFSDDFLVVDFRFRRDFSADHDHSRLCYGFTGDTGVRVLFEASIENGVRYLEDEKRHSSMYLLRLE